MRRRVLERVLDDRLGLATEDPEVVRTSVLDSLRRIFRSGQGDASTDPRYGLPDVGAICRNLPEATEEMRNAIVAAIERYEPRLRRVRVVPKPDAGGRVLRFEILAELNDSNTGGDGRFKVATRLETSGHIVIEE